MSNNPAPTTAVDPSILALAEVQSRIEVSLITLSGQIASLEDLATSIGARLTRMERAQERLESLLKQLQPTIE